MNKSKLRIKTIILSLFLLAVFLTTAFPSLMNNFIIRSLNLPKTSATRFETPDQWDDFDFIKGSGGATGDLEKNNNDFARIDAGSTISYGPDTYLGIIKPNADILKNWNEGIFPFLQHYFMIDEYPSDNNGDGLRIRESTKGVDDRWDFTTLTLPTGAVVSKLVYHVYCKKGNSEGSTWIDGDSSFGDDPDFSPTSTSYGWYTDTTTGLSKTQSDLNNFWMNVQPDDVYPFYPFYNPTWVDIETVYIEVYYKPLTTVYSFDYQITWDIIDSDLVSIDYLKYDYRATAGWVRCDLDIYNWDDPQNPWTELESGVSGMGYNYITGSYPLTDPYISAANQVKIRFQTATSSSDFDMELDQICVEYSDDDIIIISPAETNYTKMEGILLDFEPDNLDYMEYQLDANPPIEIYGDTVIPLPEEYGLHTLRVEGEKDSVQYQSEIREFTVSPISIISPQEKGYRSKSTNYLGTFSFEEDNAGDDPGESLREFYQASLGFEEDANGDEPDDYLRGVYKASIGFENEETGAPPTSFEVQTGSDCIVEIDERHHDNTPYNYHIKVVHLLDGKYGGKDDIQLTQYFYEEQSYGTIEFWFCSDLVTGTNPTAENNFRLIDIYDDIKIDLFVFSDHLNYYTQGNDYIPIENYPINSNDWYHFKITFECGYGNYDGLSPDTYNVYVMAEDETVETCILQSASFKNGGTSSLDTLKFSTSQNTAIVNSWYDAIGYSWDEFYEVGDNLQNIARWKLGQYYQLDCGAKVIASYEDDNEIVHNKVLKIWDDEEDIDVNLIHPFYDGSKASGTIEYWQLITEITETTNQRIVCIKAEDGTTNLIRLRILLGKLEYYDPTQGWTPIQPLSLSANVWDHYRIDFETTAERYMGLSQWTWRLFHNGVEYGPYNFESTSSQPAQLHLDTSGKKGNHISYFDAIGLSWDPEYVVGENFEQLSNWDVSDGDDDDDDDCSIQVIDKIDDMDEHFKVVEFFHPWYAQSNQILSMKDQISRDSGIIEYWIKVMDNQERTSVRIMDKGYYNSSDFLIINGKFKYFDGNLHDITNCEIDHWYHIKIQFDCGTNGDGTNDWHLWIDGISQDGGTGYEFQGTPKKMNLVEFESYKDSTSANDKYVYIDAIGYSWDTDYNIGDNIQPCMTLSFTGQDELNQTWYSLDGDQPIEIEGDIFFEKPTDLGEHTIQVFGRLSNGEWVESNITTFEVYDKPSLLCIHGFGNSGNIWKNHLMKKEYFIESYESIIPLNYYEKDDEPPEFDGVDYDTPIEDIAESLRDYIINQYKAETISDSLDIICFSMGGLVVRYMVKRYYDDLKAEGITIDHIATLGTPHYGAIWAEFGQFVYTQWGQMVSDSPFLNSLNSPDDTPYSISDSGPYNDIKYSIFRGAVWWWGYTMDGQVTLPCARLYSNDVKIYGNCVFWGHRCYQTDHDGLFKSSRVLRDVFKEFWYN